MFGKKQDVEVRINKHTIAVADQIYQMRNLARVQCWKLVPARAKILYRVARPALPALALLVILNFLLGAAREVSGGLAIFNILAVLAIGLVTLGRYAHAAFRRPQFVLLLETTGYPIGVLSSPKRDVIQNLVNEIANAIENPPLSPKTFHLGDVILGDQIKVNGDNPVGKVIFGG